MSNRYQISARLLSSGQAVRRNNALVGQTIVLTTNYNSHHTHNIAWNFGDGSRSVSGGSNRATVRHSYATAGLKAIRCTINKRYVLRLRIRINALPNVVEESESESESVPVSPASPAPPVITGISLRLVNNSATGNIQVLVFQKNVAANFTEASTAWQVIDFTSAAGQAVNIVYGDQQEIAAADAYGNYTPRLDSNPGQRFSITSSPSGDVLALDGSSTSPSEIELANGLSVGDVDAFLYRSNKLLGQKTGIAPAQKAVFEFRPTIWVGVVSGLTEGQELNSSVLSQINTEISLLGIQSADIVVTGGGSGPSATPFQFSLANITF